MAGVLGLVRMCCANARRAVGRVEVRLGHPGGVCLASSRKSRLHGSRSGRRLWLIGATGRRGPSSAAAVPLIDESDGERGHSPHTTTEPRGRGVGPRGDDGLRGRDRRRDPRRPPQRGGLLPRGSPHRLPGDQVAARARRPGRLDQRRRAPDADGGAGRGGRPRDGHAAPQLGARAGQRAPLRADRQAERAPAPAAERLAPDPEVGPRARGRAVGPGRAGRVAAVQGRLRGPGERLQKGRRRPRRGGRPPRGPRARRPRADRAPRPASATSTTCSAASSRAT